MGEWRRVTATDLPFCLDMIRAFMDRVVEKYQHPADPQVLTVSEMGQIAGNVDHYCLVYFESEEPKSMICGNLSVGPDGSQIFSSTWTATYGEIGMGAVDEALRRLGADALVIESPREPAVMARWMPGLEPISYIYKRWLNEAADEEVA